MLDLDYLFSKYGRPSGIIHICAQFLYVRPFYLKWNLHNTIWIEPNPFFYQLNLPSISSSQKEKIFNIAISKNNEQIIFDVNGDTSIQTSIGSKKLTDMFEENSINKEEYNFLHIGAQISTNYLEGCEDELSKFKFISMEVTKNLGNNFSDLKFVDNFLKKFRFKRVEFAINNNIGQAFYVKKRTYNKSKIVNI